MNTMHRIYTGCILLFLIITQVSCSGIAVHSKPGTTTTIILIRHADRGNTSELNETGRQRAQSLVEEVKDMGITAIYSPDINRNLDTVKPTAEYLGLTITPTPHFSQVNESEMQQAVDIFANQVIADHAGQVVLIVGNISGNLQGIFNKFGGKGAGPMNYGDLYIIKVGDKGPAQVTKKRFGPPAQEQQKPNN